MAHVFAAADDGPRANAELTEAERGRYDNLILLCPTCHTIIDKASDEYPDATILRWKTTTRGSASPSCSAQWIRSKRTGGYLAGENACDGPAQ